MNDYIKHLCFTTHLHYVFVFFFCHYNPQCYLYRGMGTKYRLVYMKCKFSLKLYNLFFLKSFLVCVDMIILHIVKTSFIPFNVIQLQYAYFASFHDALLRVIMQLTLTYRQNSCLADLSRSRKSGRNHVVSSQVPSLQRRL